MLGIKNSLTDLGSLKQRDAGLFIKMVWIILSCLLIKQEEMASLRAIHSAHLRASFFSPLCQLSSALLPSIFGTLSFFVRHSITIYCQRYILHVLLPLFGSFMFVEICPLASATSLASIGPGTLSCLRQSNGQDSS